MELNRMGNEGSAGGGGGVGVVAGGCGGAVGRWCSGWLMGEVSGRLLHTKDVPHTSTSHGPGEVSIQRMGPTHTMYVWANRFDTMMNPVRGDVPGTGHAPITTTCLWPAISETSPSVSISLIKLQSKCCKRPNKCKPYSRKPTPLSRYSEKRHTPFAIGQLTSSLNNGEYENFIA